MWVRVLSVVAALAVVGLVSASAFYLVQPVDAPGDVAAPTNDAVAPAATLTPLPTPGVPAPTAADPSPAPPPLASPEPVTAAPTGPAEDRLAQRLARVVAKAKVGNNLGVTVLDTQGRLLFGHRATEPVLPASTQKLSVAAAALARFGPQHRYTTRVTTTAGPGRAGILRGDVVIVGGGDPALAQPLFAAIEPDRPRTRLERLVTQLKRTGVRRVVGRIVADPSVLAADPIPAGWPARYFDSLDATRITGLTVDAGRTIFRKRGALQARASADPAEQTARVFRRLLRQRGIKVKAGIDVAADKTNQPVTLATVSSPPLGRILRYTVQRSDNHFADTVFRTLGAAAGDSTWIGSAQATADALAPLRLDWTDVVLADGSGLSRSNRVSTTFLAQLHSHMWASNLHEQWVDLLAVSGRSGTLRSRLAGTVGAGRLFGKTGSLRDVVSLVGTIVGTRGRLAHLAVVGNDLSSTSHMRTVTDRAALAIAEELQDCRRVRPPPKKKGGKRRPVRLVCG